MGSYIGTHEGACIWINLEPCGLICGMMTWLLLGYGMGATTYSVIVPWLGYSIHGCLHIFFFNALSLLAMYCHLRAMTVDPGSVPKGAMPTLDDAFENDTEAVGRVNKYRRFCKRCKAFKPIRAHHCSICRRCVVKMDHHCPWVNNCVGIGNQKLFLLFIFFTSVVCGYSLILVVTRFATCAMNNLECGDEAHFLVVLFLFLESLLFLLFTLCMLGDQISSMRSNQTSIDRLKNQKHDIRVEVNEVCGSPIETRFQIQWLLPIAVHFSETIREKVLGYRVNPSAIHEYCCKEEVTPLMDRNDGIIGIECKTIETKESKSESQVESDVDSSAAPVNRTLESMKDNKEEMCEGEEEGLWMGKQRPATDAHAHSSNIRKRAGPP